MGGNIFKGETRRYAPDEYREIEEHLQRVINVLFKAPVFHKIPYYAEKDSFGDLDFVLDLSNIFSDEMRRNWKDEIVAALGLNENKVSTNGDVFSFVYEQLQVDCISVSDPNEVQPAVNYYAFNDLSNLLGRITHKLGLKLSHKGLFIIVRDPENPDTSLLKEILVSRRYTDALTLIGVDPIQYLMCGFSTKEEMFQYVASSTFFQKDIFLLHNRTHRSRTRDQKRKIYHEFLEWIEKEQPEDNWTFENVREHGGYGIREPFFSEIIAPFVKDSQNGRDLHKEIEAVLDENEINKRFKSLYFNGEIVGENMCISGKELGDAMRTIKSHMLFPVTTEEKDQFMFIWRPEDGIQELLSMWNG